MVVRGSLLYRWLPFFARPTSRLTEVIDAISAVGFERVVGFQALRAQHRMAGLLVQTNHQRKGAHQRRQQKGRQTAKHCALAPRG